MHIICFSRVQNQIGFLENRIKYWLCHYSIYVDLDNKHVYFEKNQIYNTMFLVRVLETFFMKSINKAIFKQHYDESIFDKLTLIQCPNGFSHCNNDYFLSKNVGSKTLHTPFSTFLIFGHPTFLFGSRSARALLTRLTIAAEERSSTLSRFLRIKKYLVFFLMAVGSCCQNKTKNTKMSQH